ncbi:MAG: tetratricopeptide repeat protein [Verrucomicrobiota bacterium]
MFRLRLLALTLSGWLITQIVFAEQTVDQQTGEDVSIEALEKKAAANPDDLEIRYDLGIAYNEKAITGDEDALERAITIMRSILQDQPANLKAKAMLGSCTVMKAQYASIFSKLDYVEEGYTILDEVVTANPDNQDLRLIRGANAARSPSFLGRSDVADTDFNWLIKDIESRPENYDDNYKRTVYYYAGHWFLEQREKRCIDILLIARDLPGAPRLSDDIKDALVSAKKRFPTTYAKKTK